MPARHTGAAFRLLSDAGRRHRAVSPPVVSDARTAVYIRLKYRAWDVRNREREYRRCFGYRQRWAGLLGEVRQLRARGWTVGVESYNAVLRRYGGAGKAEWAERTYADMVAADVRPDGTTYRLLLNVYSRTMRRRNRKRVAELWRHLRADGSAAHTVDTLHSLVRALTLLRMSRSAHRVVRALRREEPALMADPVLLEKFYAPLILAAQRRRRRRRALVATLVDARRQRASPSSTTATATTAELPPLEDATLHALLRCAAHDGDAQRALHLFKELRDRSASGAVDTKWWSALLHAHVAACVAGLRRRRRQRRHGGDAATLLANAQLLWQRMEGVPGRVDDSGVRHYFALCHAQAVHDPASRDKVVSDALAFFDRYRSSTGGSGGRSIHVWGALMLLLAACGRRDLLHQTYETYLRAVGRPWKASDKIARRLKRALRTSQAER